MRDPTVLQIDAYCRLDIEDLETGERLTAAPGREPGDFFHSRLAVAVDGIDLESGSVLFDWPHVHSGTQVSSILMELAFSAATEHSRGLACELQPCSRRTTRL
jgi:hypothetical protein